MPLIRETFSRSIESPAQPLTAASLVEALGGPSTHAGVSVNENAVLGITAVLRAVAIIAGVGASTPLKTYRESTRERVSVRILENPHPEMTRFEFWETAWAQRALWGNAYAFKQRDGLGRIVELWLIHPRRVNVCVERDVKHPNYGDKRFEVTLDAGERKTYSSDEILHIPGLGYDGIQGFSVIHVARQSLGVALAAEEYAARFYAQDARPGGVLEVDSELTDESWRHLKEQWNSLHRGVSRAHEMAVLEGGAKWKAIGIPPEDAQLLLTRRFSVSEVARMFGLPPHLLADVERSTSWGPGIEQQNTSLVVYTLGPDYARFEQRITRELTSSGIFAEYDTNGLLRGDMKTRFESYNTAVGGPWMKPDEARAFENLEPIEGGDKLLRPLNMTSGESSPDEKEDPDDDDAS